MMQYKSPWVALPITKDKIEFKLVTFNTGSSFPEIKKCIIVNQQNQISFWINGKMINNEEINILPATNIIEFAENIQKFEYILVCKGGPKYNLFPDAPKTICNISSSDIMIVIL